MPLVGEAQAARVIGVLAAYAMLAQHWESNEDEPRLTVGDVSSDGDRHGGRAGE